MIPWSNGNVRHLVSLALLLGLTFGGLYLCYVIGRPFLNAVLIALMLAVVFHPIHDRIQRMTRRKNLAAGTSTFLVFLLAAIPLALLGYALQKELGNLVQLLRGPNGGTGNAGYLNYLRDVLLERLGRYGEIAQFNPRTVLLQWTERMSSYLLSIGAAAIANVFSFTFDVIVIFFSLFFFFREGSSLRRKILELLPLSAEQADRLTNRISETLIANVHGSLAVGGAQGLLTGLSFLVLGIPAPILWGLVTGLASLVPVVGSALVWGPAALVLVLTGHWVKALILVGWGAGVVGQIDVLVRPYVVGAHIKIHSLLIFFALLGGVEAFGVVGIFLGPLILSVTLALLDVLKTLDLTWQADSSSPLQVAADAKRP